MERQTGCVHIYCGDGKGKTTCGMGLCVRAAGYGYRVLIYQFMKDNSTSERKAMEKIPGITFVPGLKQEKFSFQMTDQEKEEQARLRQDYINSVRANLRAQLNNINIQNEDGSVTNLGEEHAAKGSGHAQ